MFKKPKIQTTERDIKILTYLWQWKFLSTAAIHLRYFPGVSLQAAYLRLNKLAGAGLIQQVPVFATRHFAWSISKKGFGYIRETLPPLRAETLKSSSPWHDALCSAIHIGECLSASPKGIQLFSERQISAYEPEILPSWLPDCYIHTPDGFWHLNQEGESQTIALEIQLTRQRHEWSEKVMTFYGSSPTVNSVVWIIGSKSVAASLVPTLRKLASDARQQHFFFYLDHVMDEGWRAKHFGTHNNQRTLSDILLTKPLLSSEKSKTQALFNFRKKPNIQSIWSPPPNP